MRISRRWLNKYIAIKMADGELAERLTMAGLEVESVSSQADSLRGILVGEVRSVEKHPAADRLSICFVFDGKNEIQVVCGAPNVASGQKVAFAPSGTVVPKNQHDPSGGGFTLGNISIRGVESKGMICSGYELGISDDRDGILVLTPSARPGMALSLHLKLDDTIFDIGVTANRPDLLNHIGVAREVGAITGASLKIPHVRVKSGRTGTSYPLKVSVIDRGNCPRYTARVIGNIKIGPSPAWLQNLLEAVDIRPINNVVDVTNYVLMEIGQPLHAFDYDRLSGHEIIVRGNTKSSPFVTLDGKERKIDEETLLICDGTGMVALAGIMGGKNSEISDNTTTIVLESAYFNPVSIRRSSKKLGLSTEASQRFERGADPNITSWALDRATQLLTEITPGAAPKTSIDIYPKKIREKVVRFHAENSNQLLGIKLTPKMTSNLLKRIGIAQTGSKNKSGESTFKIPTWRPDITREVDLIEEVARLHGYDNIDSDASIRLTLGTDPVPSELEDIVRDQLSSSGYQEIITNSMLDPATSKDPESEQVRITNPISREMAGLRTNLLNSMLTVIKHNIFNGILSSRFYEIGNVYFYDSTKPTDNLSSYREEQRLMLAVYGFENPTFWGEEVTKSSIFTLKGVCNALIRNISLDNPVYIPYSTPTALSERSIFIEISGERVGTIGIVSTNLLNQYELESEIYFLDISLDSIRRFSKGVTKFRQYSKFPTVFRDLAIVVKESVSVGKIEETIRASAGKILGDIELFDIYRGDQLEKGKKSCAFSLEFVPQEKTLDQREILTVMERITESVASAFNATLRQ